jgi:hypothetical protein
MVCECKEPCGDKYQNGKIYLIKSLLNPKRVYVGSTCNMLAVRWASHILSLGKSMTSVDKEASGDWDNWCIELYELYACDCKMMLKRREGVITKEIGTINQRVAGTTECETRKNYYEKNKEKNKDYYKIYYENNKEKCLNRGKEKVECENCKSLVSKKGIAQHKRSDKCINFKPN